MTDALASEITALAQQVIKKATVEGLLLATAESCTGGLIGGALTEIAGSSAAFDRGFITYSNTAKNQMLDVPMAMIDAEGAVSGDVACAMADGALAHSSAHIAIAVTGIAGPGGGSKAKPVGLVWFGLATKDGTTISEQRIFEDKGRGFIRQQTVITALGLLQSALITSSGAG